ncbi:MAG: Long-chain-fatty-acid--CoA ligase [Candidatus Thorarchaeota archaeon AB_25]|nr:MAG: Long-chain-fatty-acid--CoA ligase [Candidatus Thorarchaeota archaeon AB_25]
MDLNDWSWIGDWTGRRALLTPKKEATVDNIQKKRYTFDAIDKRANQVARLLLDSGVQKGDRIGVYSKNRFDFLDILFACGKIGAILTPFNNRLTTTEIEYLLKKTDPAMVFYDPDLGTQFGELRPHLEKQHVFVMGDKKYDTDSDLYSLMNKKSSNAVERPAITLDDPYLIVFTGGTTGLPKGAVLSHGLVLWNSVNTIVSWGLRPDDIQPLLFPLFHTGGINVLLIPFIHLGAKSIIMGDFDVDKTLQVIVNEQCTLVVGVPTMFNMMAQSKNFTQTNFDNVRVFISGGAPCPVAIMEKYWERGKILKMGYGLTEVGPNNFYLPDDEVKRKPTSVGFPVFHCDMKIVDNDNNEVSAGAVGELMLRGPHIFSGYWEEPEETSKTIELDGWVHTGDLVMKDEEGFFFITGRKKDMFISGGENIFPTEIEELLFKHPSILEAAVVGVPNEKWGEVGKAFIVLKQDKTLDEDEVLKYLDGKIARYKIPKHYEFRDELPKSAAGKILKRELIDLGGD